MRAVPRHLFVPAASLEDAYANTTVHIKYDEGGQSISCASQPGRSSTALARPVVAAPFRTAEAYLFDLR